MQHILSETKHRPWKLPYGKWQYYQEWNDALFIHFEVNYEMLRNLVPDQLNIDQFKGKYYISVVAFKMEKIRPRNLPSVSFISDFYEINVRTYINNNDKQGVYFLNIEAEKQLSAFVARTLSGLPYEKSEIKRSENHYTNKNSRKNFSLTSAFKTGEKIKNKSAFDLWLTERYCLYLLRNNELLRYEIHHKEWPLYSVKDSAISLHYKFGPIELTGENMLNYHYSPGVEVLSWKAEKL
ncbi:YqjF family protein [Elizabethkingia meningoseptica]|uniref:YqjF family protein n=1 Tax=Elizabethkingia meningoseptica TaxID=238 RepID=UPI0038911AD5